MFEFGTMIDIGLGLILIYASISLIVSGLQEAISTISRTRSNTLKEGVNNLLGDPAAKKFYEHSLIKALSHKSKTRQPSYIPSARFADVIIDLLNLTDGAPLDQQLAKQSGTDKGLLDIVQPLARKAQGDMSALRKELASLFDDSMDRVSGWYVRNARIWSIFIAAFVVIFMNVDSIRIAQEVSRNEVLRIKLIAVSEMGLEEENLSDEILKINELPIGWACPDTADMIVTEKADTAEKEEEKIGSWGVCVAQNFSATTLFGWIMTIAAVSLGAPFWFDLLSKVARLRGTGVKPENDA